MRTLAFVSSVLLIFPLRKTLARGPYSNSTDSTVTSLSTSTFVANNTARLESTSVPEVTNRSGTTTSPNVGDYIAAGFGQTSTASSSSVALGDYVAAGLGQTSAESSSPSFLPHSYPTSPSIPRVGEIASTLVSSRSNETSVSSDNATAYSLDQIRVSSVVISTLPSSTNHFAAGASVNSSPSSDPSSSVASPYFPVSPSTLGINATNAINAINATNLTSALPPVRNISLASTGEGSYYASICDNLWNDYRERLWAGRALSTLTALTTTNCSANIITLCDGNPRVLGTLTPTATGSTTILQRAKDFSLPTPACSVQPSDCAALYSSFSSADSLYLSALSMIPLTTLALASNLQTFVSNNMTTTFAEDAVPPTLIIDDVAYTLKTDISTVYDIEGFGELWPGYTSVAPGQPPVPKPTQSPYCTNNRLYTPSQSSSTDCSALSSIYKNSLAVYLRSSRAWYSNLQMTTLSLASDMKTFISGNHTTIFKPNPTINDTRATLTVDSYTYLPSSLADNLVYYYIDYYYPSLNPDGIVTGGLYNQIFTEVTLPTSPTCEMACSDLPCTIFGGDVQLLYFPVSSTVSRDMCTQFPNATGALCPLGPLETPLSDIAAAMAGHHHGAIICPYVSANISTKDSGPYIVINATTFYKNRTYISMQTAYALNDCGSVGSRYAGGLLTLESSDLFSIRGRHHVAYSFDFADLSTPIPWSAYSGVPSMLNGLMQECADWSSYDFINGERTDRPDCGKTIYDAAYKPVLAVPLPARGLDPAWANCVLDLDGWYDPPKALEAATTLEPASIPTTPATPEPSVGHAFPIKTTMDSSTFATTTSIADGQAPKGSQSPNDTPAYGGDTAPSSSQENSDPEQSQAGSATEGDGASLPTPANPDTTAQTFSPSQAPDNQQNDPSAEVSNSMNMPAAPDATPLPVNGDPQATSIAGQSATSMDGIEILLSLLDQKLTKISPAVSSPDPASRLLGILGGLKSTTGEVAVQSSSLPNDAEQDIHTPGSVPVPVAPASIGTVPVSVAFDGDAVFGSQTLSPGVEMTIDGTPISVGAGTVVIASIGNPGAPGTTIVPQTIPESNEGSLDGDTEPVVPSSLRSIVVAADGNIFTISPGQATNVIVVNSARLTVKGPGVTANGHILSAYNGGVAIGTSSVHLAPGLFSGAAAVNGDLPGSADIVTIGSTPLSDSFDPPGLPGAVVVGSKTLSIDGPAATINGDVVSAGSAGLVIGRPTTPSDSVTDPSSAVIIDGVSVSAWDSGLVVGESSHTLLQHLPALFDSAVFAASVVVGSQTLLISTASPGASIIYVQSQAISIGGAAVIINGVVVSAYSRGLAIGDSTLELPGPTASFINSPTSRGLASVITVDSQTFTISEPSPGASVVFVGSQQLSVGGQVTTVNGIRVSAGTAGIVVGGSTIILPTNGALASESKNYGVESPLEQSVSAITASAPSGDDGVVSTGVTGAARISSKSSSGIKDYAPRLPSVLFALLAATICLVI